MYIISKKAELFCLYETLVILSRLGSAFVDEALMVVKRDISVTLGMGFTTLDKSSTVFNILLHYPDQFMHATKHARTTGCYRTLQ